MSILSGIATVASVLNLIRDNKDKGKEVVDTLRKQLPENLRISDSYISFTKPFVINPLTIVDESLQYDEGLPAIMSTANLVFASYYTLALQADSVLGSATVRQKLDKFNPERDIRTASMEAMNISMEAFQGGLPSLEAGVVYSEEAGVDPKDPRQRATKSDVDTIAEAIERDEQLKRKRDREDASDIRTTELNRRQDEEYTLRQSANSTDIKEVIPKENKNLFLGRTYAITLVEGLQSIDVSVVIRLMTSVIDKDSMTHMLSLGKYAFKGFDRFQRWRAGSLSFADLFLCRDILDAHRSALRNDTSGIYREITKRGINNSVAAMSSKQASVGTNSGIAVISEDTARDIEFRIGDKLDKASVRERLFQALNLMILFVYDPAYGHVTMYQRGLKYATETTIKELKGGSDKADKGADVTELFKRIAAGDKLF